MVPTSITRVYRTYHPLPQPSPRYPICSTTPRLHSELMLKSRCTPETCEKLAVRHLQYCLSTTALW